MRAVVATYTPEEREEISRRREAAQHAAKADTPTIPDGAEWPIGPLPHVGHPISEGPWLPTEADLEE